MHARAAGRRGPVKVQDEINHERRMLKPLPYTDPDTRALASVITRDIYRHNPNVRWADVIELDDEAASEGGRCSDQIPQLFTGLLSPWKGVLLYGPPGQEDAAGTRRGNGVPHHVFQHQCFFHCEQVPGRLEKLVWLLFELARYHAPSTTFIVR